MISRVHKYIILDLPDGSSFSISLYDYPARETVQAIYESLRDGKYTIEYTRPVIETGYCHE